LPAVGHLEEENRAVKRTVIVAVGVLALGVMVYVGRLWAQTGAPAAAPEPRTRVALLNLNYVIKKYGKFVAFQDEIKRVVGPYQTQDQQTKARAEQLAKEARAPTTPANRREEIQNEMKGLQRKVQDLKEEFEKVVGKRQEEQLKILYKDVQDASHRYAMAHNFDLVLHYNDATTSDEYYSGANIARKIQAGACMPLYAAPGMDISEQVVASLNAAYGQAAPATGAPAAGTPATAAPATGAPTGVPQR